MSCCVQVSWEGGKRREDDSHWLNHFTHTLHRTAKQDNTLVMSMEDRPVLELPLGAVSQCVLPGTSTTKTEVELQFIETDAADRDEDALVEVCAA